MGFERRAHKKLVYINIDGFSFSYLERLKRKGKAGGFQRLQNDGFLFTGLRSGLVSITNPMQSAILCGAWSEKTHNFYQHYDLNEGRVIKHKRTFCAENAAQALLRTGHTVASIHQFMLENNPCREGDAQCAYFRCGKDPSDSRDRFALLKRMALGQAVYTGERKIVYSELPDFTAFYIDDIDSLGHNNAYGSYPKRATFEERQRDIEERLEVIQQELEDFVDICKQRGLFQNMAILITTDHGMTPFYGKSSLPDLLVRLNGAGIKATLPEMRTTDTQVIVLPYTIEASLYCIHPLTQEQRQTLLKVCRSAPYMQQVLEKEEMRHRYGMDSRGPDFLLCPHAGSHFYHKDVSEDTFGASHDSLDETSQHIFGMLIGGKVRHLVDYPEAVSAIDLLPTLLHTQFGCTMRDSTGKIWHGWFEDNQSMERIGAFE